MVFSSVVFLCFFLPIVVAAYYVAPRRARNAVLVVASVVFYTWGAGWVVLVLGASIAANFLFGRSIERRRDRGDLRAARRLLAAGIVLDVGTLVWFKYANFGVETGNAALGVFGLPPTPWAEILLPIGISFYTFHSLSYLIDVYRGTARHLAGPLDFALYILFFPQLIAGPIVRFHEIRDQLLVRRGSADEFAIGATRFALGLGKKVLIADTIAPVVDAIFATPTDELGTASAVLGVVGFAAQLYFDFSGYSDMAIGLGHMFGFRLPENFARPYSSRSVTEFWRRWHMSLSRWFRDYVYIPLGGNRGSDAQTYRNLILVFLLTGLWHGAAWTFVLWGAYHGVGLIVERLASVGRGVDPDGEARSTLGAAVSQGRTVVFVLGGWILFRSPDLEYAAGYAGALLRPGTSLTLEVALLLGPLVWIALGLAVATVLLPRTWVTGVELERLPTRMGSILRWSAIGVILPAALVIVLAGDFSPFLYYQF